MRTLLRVEPGMEPYAIRFGAKSTAGRWYYDGELPNALCGLAISVKTSPAMDALQTLLAQRLQMPVPAPSKRVPSGQPAPQCLRCHRQMVQKTNGKTGALFWGCVNFPACKETFRVGDVCERTESSPADVALVQAMEATIRFAMERLGRRANRWLGMPMVGLGGKPPYNEMVTLEGCRKVYALIRRVSQ